VVAEQRDAAALARAGDDVVGVRPAADHVAQRPELVRAVRVRRRDHGLQRVGVRVRVPEHGDDHGE
jgi:hypothetical protein